MSEILRAVMDANCVYSAPAFYAGRVTQAITNTGTKTFIRRQASIPCRQDVWFLAQGAAQTSTFISGAGNNGTSGKTLNSTFQIQRAANQEAFSNAAQVKCNQNYNFNNFVTWDEYILFAPGELIILLQDVVLTLAGTSTEITSVTLMGIEYQMPSNMGVPSYG